MTNQSISQEEIQAALNQYAKEDVSIAMKKGYMAITDTKQGVIFLECEDGKLTASNCLGEHLTGKMNKTKMVTWLTQQYQVMV